MAEHINFKRKRGGRVIRVEADSAAAKRMSGLNKVWDRVGDDVQTVEEAARPEVDAGDLPAIDEANDGDLEDLTVDELKDRLRARDLPVTGSKADLVDRLSGA